MDQETRAGMRLLVAINDPNCGDLIARTAASILQVTGGEATFLALALKKQNLIKIEKLLDELNILIEPFPVSMMSKIGGFSEVITDETAGGQYDLVILGEQPDNTLLRYLYPHPLERVLKELTTPVLFTRRYNRPLQRFLVCEGGQSSRLMPAITGGLKPLMLKAEIITLLHVMSQISASPGLQGWELVADADELIGHHTPEGEQLEYDLAALKSLA